MPPFDPDQPANQSALSSQVMRSQLTSLKSLIDDILTLNAAQIDGVTTLPAGDPAEASVSVVGNTLHFTFAIPQGSQGGEGGQGPQGIQGEPGMPGAPGEVSFQQLTDAIATTSSNSNGVSTLEMTVNDPPTQGEVQLIANKLDELILMLRR